MSDEGKAGTRPRTPWSAGSRSRLSFFLTIPRSRQSGLTAEAIVPTRLNATSSVDRTLRPKVVSARRLSMSDEGMAGTRPRTPWSAGSRSRLSFYLTIRRSRQIGHPAEAIIPTRLNSASSVDRTLRPKVVSARRLSMSDEGMAGTRPRTPWVKRPVRNRRGLSRGPGRNCRSF